MNNGVTGDPRPSTKEIGKDLIDIIVNNGVNEIRKMTAERRAAHSPLKQLSSLKAQVSESVRVET